MIVSASYGGTLQCAEILLSAHSSSLYKLGKKIISNIEGCEIALTGKADEHYKFALEKFVIEHNANEKLNVRLEENKLIVFGYTEELLGFGETLVAHFGSQNADGYHLHYDYLNGHGLLGICEHSLVVSQDNTEI